MNRTKKAVYNLLKEMALNNDNGGAKKNILRRETPIFKNEVVKAFIKHVVALTRQLKNQQHELNSVVT